MKGFVPTPEGTVETMVKRLFKNRHLRKGARLLDPGCGNGAFIDGVLHWCRCHNAPQPEIVGVELDPEKLHLAKKRLAGQRGVTLLQGDFLTIDIGTFDYVIGNPPYVAIYGLSGEERTRYRQMFRTARGRLDLYLLFWERALQLLRPDGRLVFITPEKFTYVETARPLREILSFFQVEEIFFAAEDTFPDLITYPTITTVINSLPLEDTVVRTRDDKWKSMRVPSGGQSWQPLIYGSFAKIDGTYTLQDLTARISCGVATGADAVFVRTATALPRELKRLSYPTLAGRELRLGEPLPEPRRRMLMPYNLEGHLLPEEKLEALGEYLCQSEIRERLESRTCVRRKPWYAFHETPRLRQILRPKLLSKDLTAKPFFWIDREGDIIPQHSVYYIVPRMSEFLDPLAHFLNSEEACSWLRSHCHRAANNFLRVQSAILKKMPVPDSLADSIQSETRMI